MFGWSFAWVTVAPGSPMEGHNQGGIFRRMFSRIHAIKQVYIARSTKESKFFLLELISCDKN